MDESIIAEAGVTLQRLWDALLAEISPEGRQLLYLYQVIFLGRLWLLGDLRPGPDLDMDGLRLDMLEMMPIALAFGEEVAQAA